MKAKEKSKHNPLHTLASCVHYSFSHITHLRGHIVYVHFILICTLFLVYFPFIYVHTYIYDQMPPCALSARKFKRHFFINSIYFSEKKKKKKIVNPQNYLIKFSFKFRIKYKFFSKF